MINDRRLERSNILIVEGCRVVVLVFDFRVFIYRTGTDILPLSTGINIFLALSLLTHFM